MCRSDPCEGFIIFKFNVEKNFREQEGRTGIGMNEHGIFADPAETGALRQFAFEDGAGISVIAVGNGMPDLLFDELDDLPQFWRNNLMVIIPQRICGNVEFRLLPSAFQVFIRQCQNENGLASGEDQAWVGAA